MTSDRSRRIEELFEQALDQPRERRSRFLEERCAGDPTLRREVESLLAHHAEEFLEQPEHLAELPPAPVDLDDPERVGPYRIVRTLGTGGMGVVFLAEQREPIRREVALKLVKLGMDTDQVVSRFESERQTLAMMNHPNIAQVYDAGATEQGRPYFVMEYVDGVPITRHSRDVDLDIRGRLELFLQVCDGIQHAHQKGIIHRDIKASNVLVAARDGSAVPKIIDFGIARATDQRHAEVTAFTELGLIVGTPEYMSPEQADWTGKDIDTRTDVYSLGVLLYELLAGVLPFDAQELRQGGFEALCRKIREENPPLPSVRVARSGDPQAARQIAGDLDWITLRALEKDRERRYSSASELAADLRRHLADEPVLARPPGAAYRVGKFVRRHRLGVAAAALLLLVLVGGIIGTTIGMLQARRGEAVAREAERFLVGAFRVPDPDSSQGQEITAREILDNGAARIREEFETQPRVQARLMGVMGRAYRGLGLYDSSEPLLRESLEMKRRTLGRNDPELLDGLNELANVLVKNQQYEASLPYYTEALAIAERTLADDDPDLATILKNLGDVHAKIESFELSREFHQRSLAIRRRQFGPESPEFARSLTGVADMLARAGDPVAAIPLHEESLRIRQANAESEQSLTLGYGHYYLGDAFFRAGRFSEAAAQIETALRIWESSLGAEHEQVGACAFRLAEAYEGAAELVSADRFYDRALAVDSAAFGAEDPRVLEALEGYAEFLERRGLVDRAAPLRARAEKIREVARTP